MADVLLINSPLFHEPWQVSEINEDSLPPLGLGYIATDLKKHSIDVELLDAVFENLSVHQIQYSAWIWYGVCCKTHGNSNVLNIMA